MILDQSPEEIIAETIEGEFINRFVEVGFTARQVIGGIALAAARLSALHDRLSDEGPAPH
ncbi:hypothetical protein [Sphingobium sp.]|uniref:hypothetical protein n=1 Tax=Sphingobium sp. TaxID=1912891 RepID=UPI003BB74063